MALLIDPNQLGSRASKRISVWPTWSGAAKAGAKTMVVMMKALVRWTIVIDFRLEEWTVV
jgi:hypothetical protein